MDFRRDGCHESPPPQACRLSGLVRALNPALP
jgi:hypothetical protein